MSTPSLAVAAAPAIAPPLTSVHTGAAEDYHRVLRRLVGGTIGGFMQAATSHPFDTIKSRVQNGLFPSVSSCVRHTWKEEGLHGFYRGATPILAFCGFQNFTLFSLNQTMNNYMTPADHDRRTPLPLWRTAVAAQLTAPLYVLTVVPVEKVKVQLQMIGKGGHESATVTGPITCIRRVIQTEGYRGLLSGYTPTLMSRLIGLPFYFMGYQKARSALLDSSLASTHTGREVLVPILSGVAAGMCFWTSNYPCDFVKTRVQASRTRVSIPDVIRSTYKAGGIRGFYKGYTACIMRSAPANASVWLGIELTTTFMISKGW
ncbi:putative Mitochondrial carrier protein [Leptomonas seymouri]|uniref:Putative Mitochondrial carrier protein n=1 Tax=Leptomonas seymouri TaxID=5684 RepID=A0A0N1I8T5_LEPSE|nr:putative Mitochondrial carrier protein [Leptomonas seymouri]|eukprot:KPI89373.1 putative Mitochondrial carrier protein [Leptomonas seymouri]